LIQRDYTSYFDYYTHADAGSPEITGKAVDPSQIFETDLGRKVYGGGGITPDVIVQDDELLPFEQFLLARNAYLNFAIDYTNRNKSRIKADWRPGQELVQEFRDWVVKEKIATAQEIDEALQKDEIRDYSQLQIRAEVMNSLFGQEARHRVLTEGDKQLQAALNLFGRAATMLSQRQELGAPNPRIQRTEESPKGRL
jgi:carboxyl-terminal processing protease